MHGEHYQWKSTSNAVTFLCGRTGLGAHGTTLFECTYAISDLTAYPVSSVTSNQQESKALSLSAHA